MERCEIDAANDYTYLVPTSASHPTSRKLRTRRSPPIPSIDHDHGHDYDYDYVRCTNDTGRFFLPTAVAS